VCSDINIYTKHTKCDHVTKNIIVAQLVNLLNCISKSQLVPFKYNKEFHILQHYSISCIAVGYMSTFWICIAKTSCSETDSNRQFNKLLALVCLKVNLCENLSKQQNEVLPYFEWKPCIYYLCMVSSV